MHICSIHKVPSQCDRCGKGLTQYARMDDGCMLGLDCASTVLYGAIQKMDLVAKVIRILQDGLSRGESTRVVMARAQKVSAYLPLRAVRDGIEVLRDLGPGQGTSVLARVTPQPLRAA